MPSPPWLSSLAAAAPAPRVKRSAPRAPRKRGAVGGESVANVRIHTHTSILDGIITLATFGVLSPRSVSYEGVIVEAPPSQ